MKKVLAGLVVAGMLTSGMSVFAEDAVVVEDTAVVETVEEIDSIETEATEEDAAVVEETEVVEEVTEIEVTEETTEEVVAEEVVAEEVATEEAATEETEAVEIDFEAVAKNAFMLGVNKVELAEGMGSIVLVDGVIFVPVRAALEAAGYQVTWSDKEQMVMGANQANGAMFIMQLDNTNLFYLTAEGQECKLTMEAAPFKNAAEWRTYVPVSAFAEALGYKVGVDAENATIALSK